MLVDCDPSNTKKPCSAKKKAKEPTLTTEAPAKVPRPLSTSVNEKTNGAPSYETR